jgi:hypothetical protein
MVFSTMFVGTLSHSKNSSARHYQTRTYVFMSSIRYSFPILIKLEFFDTFSKDIQTSNLMKFRPGATEMCNARLGEHQR